MLGSLMEDKRLDFDAPLLSVRRFSGSGAAAPPPAAAELAAAAAAASNGVRRSPLPTYMSELKSGRCGTPASSPSCGSSARASPRTGPARRQRPRPRRGHRRRRGPRPRSSGAASALHERPEWHAPLFFRSSSRELCEGPLARDFMMGRFLPAAQAVASGSPQYTFRKAANPKQPERVVTRDHWRRPPVPLPFQHTPNYNSNLQYLRPPLPPEGEESYENDEEEEEDDDYDARHFPSSGCGFLPKFCLKSSLCLLNPVPALKVRGRPPPPPHARRSAGPSIRSSHNATLSQAGDEHSWEAVYKHKLGQKYQSRCEDGRSKLTNDSNQLTYWSDSQTADGSSPFHRSTGEGSPLRNEARESPFHEGKGLLGVPNRDRKSSKGDCSDLGEKDGEDCWDTTPQNSSQQGSGSGSMSPAAEKGVEVDSVDVPDADPKVRIESGEKDFEIEEVSRKIKESSIIEARNRDERGLPTTLAVSDPGEINGRETFKCNKISDGPFQSKGKDLIKKNFKPVQSKPPAQSVFGIQVQQKKQALRAMTNQPPKPQHRQTRFAEVLAKPTSLNSEF
uniref:Uncharacterized protein n=1 Tax=Ananas comosus var. bracteatus TaxID=296719 RepID=A0A6V7NYS7_ANACO|nr:unnamed protein product [Ananas comosus var. bracteatus]